MFWELLLALCLAKLLSSGYRSRNCLALLLSWTATCLMGLLIICLLLTILFR